MQTASSSSPIRLISSLTNVVPQPLRLQGVPTETWIVKSSSSSTMGTATGAGAGVMLRCGIVPYVSFPSTVSSMVVKLAVEGGLGADSACGVAEV